MPSRLDATFFALADPTRRAILSRLASGEASVMELAKPFDMSQPALAKHLKVLVGAGVIGTERRGLWAYYFLLPDRLEELRTWLS